MLFWLLCIIPYDITKVEHAPRIEINTKRDDDGRVCFRQCIVWDVDNYRGWRIRGWRIIKGEIVTQGSIIFIDNSALREITAGQILLTDTEYDPELEERKNGLERRDLIK